MEAKMSEGTEARDVRMEPADNGCIIRYYEKTQNGTYDYSMNPKSEVFEFKPNDKAGMMKAMQRFCELACIGKDDED